MPRGGTKSEALVTIVKERVSGKDSDDNEKEEEPILGMRTIAKPRVIKRIGK